MLNPRTIPDHAHRAVALTLARHGLVDDGQDGIDWLVRELRDVLAGHSSVDDVAAALDDLGLGDAGDPRTRAAAVALRGER